MQLFIASADVRRLECHHAAVSVEEPSEKTNLLAWRCSIKAADLVDQITQLHWQARAVPQNRRDRVDEFQRVAFRLCQRAKPR